MPCDPFHPASFSVRDLADRYAVTAATVLSWIRSGELRAINVGRRPDSRKPRWRVTKEALDAFESRRTPSPEAAATARAPRRRKRPADVVEFY